MKVKSFVTAMGLTLALSLGLGTTSAMAIEVTKNNCIFCNKFSKSERMQNRCNRISNTNARCKGCSKKFLKICKNNNFF